MIDVNKVALEATQEGQAQIAVPKGQHSILVKYVGMVTEPWGKAISWFSIILADYVLWLSKTIKGMAMQNAIVVRLKFLNPVKSSD